MRIRPDERQMIAEIFREEIEEAKRRMAERLSEFESRTVSVNDGLESIRRFYEDLADNIWTDDDEETLRGLSGLGEKEIKRLLRMAFRRSQVQPVPSLAYLVNLHKKEGSEAQAPATGSLANPDAISALERERIANLLHSELEEAAKEIARRLRVAEKVDIVREELQRVEGNIISRFTPLV